MNSRAAQFVAALTRGSRAHDPLGRLRWLFTLFGLGNVLIVVASVGLLETEIDTPVRVAAVVGTAVAAGLWLYAYRRGSFDLPIDLTALVCVAAASLAAIGSAQPEPVKGVLFADVLIASLYGSLRGVLVRGAILAAVAVAPAVAGQGDVPAAAYVGVALLITGCVTHTLPAFVDRYEQGARREQILAGTGLALVAAADLELVVAKAVEGAVSLCGDLAGARVWVLLADAGAALDHLEVAPVAPERAGLVGRRVAGTALEAACTRDGGRQVQVRLTRGSIDRVRAAGVPVLGGELLLTPLTVDGATRGFIGVESSTRAPHELAATIAALVTQLSLAISRSDLQRAAVERGAAERFKALVQNSSDVIVIVDPDCRARFISPSAEPLFGYDAEALVGRFVTEIVHPSEVESVRAAIDAAVANPSYSPVVECQVRHARGLWRHTETRITNLLAEPAVGGIVLNTRDVTERQSLEAELRHQAFHDSLTGLANRALFVNRVQHAIDRSRREGHAIAVLFIDLDGFKRLNDSLGYAAGDAALQATADRLRTCVRSPDTVARLGADEFAVLLDGLSSPSDSTLAVERILGVLRQPLALPAASVELQPHIGIAVSLGGDETPDELLRNGAVAMHRAKTMDGGYTIFDPEMHAAALRRLEVESQLRKGIEEEQLVLHYQPTIDLHSGRLLGVEALVRWQHPTRGLVAPMEFIPLAEETGLIVPLGRWAMREACRQVRKWQQEIPGRQPLSLSVNLSARQLRHPMLVRDVADALDDSGMLPSRLILELTESVLMTDTAATLNKLFQLKAIGVRLAIDDFGTGYSSFSYLRRFPIDILKIDKSFVDGVATEPTAGALVDAMIRIGKTLRMETVAEGVERTEQADHLRALKCDVAQGFLYSRPLCGEALTALLLERAGDQEEVDPAASAA